MDGRTRVVVAGAGIGGLAAALGLVRAGFDVVVLERAAALKEVGAGLTLSPGAMRSLDLLGVADDVEATIARTPAFPTLHFATGEVLVEGRAPAGPPARLAKGHMLRAELHSLLARHVEAVSPGTVRLGQQVVGVGSGASVRLADGSTVHGDVVIGADGVRSAVRASLFGEATALPCAWAGESTSAPVFTGRVAYRFLLPAALGIPFIGAGPAAVYVGRGATFNRYRVAGGTVLNCVALSTTDRWADEGWSHPATRADLLAAFPGWHPDVLALMERAPEDSLARWGVFQRPPLTSWSRGPVALLGDAAHPMLPFLGLGAAMAIEDAAILTRTFTELDTPDEAIAAYERARIPRTTRVFHESARQGEVFDTVDPARFATSGAPSHDEVLRDYRPELVTL